MTVDQMQLLLQTIADPSSSYAFDDAWDSLRQLGPDSYEVMPSLVDAVDLPDSSVRLFAILALTRVATRETMSAGTLQIVARHAADKDHVVARSAIAFVRAWGFLDPQYARDQLRATFKNWRSFVSVRFAAYLAYRGLRRLSANQVSTL